MKILIANPPWENDIGHGIRSNSRWPHLRPDKHLQFPIFLAYTAAVLEQDGHNVKVIDACADESDSQAFLKGVEEFGPAMVFMESATPTIDQDLANAHQLKKAGYPVYLFGTHITSFYKDIIPHNKEIDGFIRGEFEFIIRDIARHLPKNEIKGLAYWEHTRNVMQVNSDAPLIENLDELPMAARHLFNFEDYYIHLDPKPNALLVATRGCPYRCTYCIWPQVMYGHRQRTRSPQNICDELEFLVQKQKIVFFRFDDDIFSLNANYTISFCEEFMSRGLHKKLPWACFGHVNANSESMYQMMARAGCQRIDFGVESGSEKILNIMKKNISIEKAKRTFDLCRKYGIRTYADYMLGFPYETEEDIQKTIDSAIYLDPDYIQISYCIPIPGTSMYFDGIKNGYIDPHLPFSKYDSTGQICNTGDVDQDRLKVFYNRFWKRFYLRPRLIQRELKRAVTSYSEFTRVLRGFRSFYKRVFGANRL